MAVPIHLKPGGARQNLPCFEGEGVQIANSFRPMIFPFRSSPPPPPFPVINDRSPILTFEAYMVMLGVWSGLFRGQAMPQYSYCTHTVPGRQR